MTCDNIRYYQLKDALKVENKTIKMPTQNCISFLLHPPDLIDISLSQYNFWRVINHTSLKPITMPSPTDQVMSIEYCASGNCTLERQFAWIWVQFVPPWQVRYRCLTRIRAFSERNCATCFKRRHSTHLSRQTMSAACWTMTTSCNLGKEARREDDGKYRQSAAER